MVTFHHVPHKPMADIMSIAHITGQKQMHRVTGPTTPPHSENRASPTVATPRIS